MPAQHFEDFRVGDTYAPPPRTITEGEVMAFAALSGDINPVHTDAVFAQDGVFGERIAHGLLGLAAAGGFLSRVGVVDGTAVALLDVAWRFRAPVRFGDTLGAEISVAETRETKDPTRGIVAFDFRLTNQDGQLVQDGRHVFMVKRR